MDIPKITHVYRHHSGREYTVVLISNEKSTDHAKFPPTVSYQGFDGAVWSRPISEFNEKFVHVRGVVPVVELDPEGHATAEFTDAEGNRVDLMEGRSNRDLVYLCSASDTAIAIDKNRARSLIAYLVHFIANGGLPDTSLEPSLIFGKLLDDERTDYLRLKALVMHPELHFFADGVIAEAVHQSERWGKKHDAQKEPTDFVFLVGFLLGKAIEAIKKHDHDRARHHCIAAGAVVFQMFDRLRSDNESPFSVFSPGITPPTAL